MLQRNCQFKENRRISRMLLWTVVYLFLYVRFFVSLIIAFPIVAFKSGLSNFFSSFSRLHKHAISVPGGIYAFSGLVGWFAPYSASIAPLVHKLTEEECEATMNDWPWLRNPFNSVHALAQSNLGELASGLVMLSALQKRKHLRGIVTSINMQYHAKARGTLTAKGSIESLDNITQTCEKKATSLIYDSKCVHVSTAVITWTISLKESSNNNSNNNKGQATKGKKSS